MQLDDEFLQHFMSTFYGSGNYLGDYWFIGLEEGGGNDLVQVSNRLDAWKELGETELVDIYEFHIKINLPEYFTDPVKLQRTWMQQARIILSAKSLPSDKESVREYQRDTIGRKNSETCLLELLPLPSPSISIWHYDNWTSLKFLQNRKIYRDYCIPWRVKNLQSRIYSYKPKMVVFMGLSYFNYWQSIVGRTVSFVEQNGYWSGQADRTKFIISQHPAAHGITNDYFETIGSHIYCNR